MNMHRHCHFAIPVMGILLLASVAGAENIVDAYARPAYTPGYFTTNQLHTFGPEVTVLAGRRRTGG